MTEGQYQRSMTVHHKRWADLWNSVAIVLTIGLFIATSFVMDEAAGAAVDRIGAAVLLGTIIIVTCAVQAAGQAIARLEIALRVPRDKEIRSC